MINTYSNGRELINPSIFSFLIQWTSIMSCHYLSGIRNFKLNIFFYFICEYFEKILLAKYKETKNCWEIDLNMTNISVCLISFWLWFIYWNSDVCLLSADRAGNGKKDVKKRKGSCNPGVEFDTILRTNNVLCRWRSRN